MSERKALNITRALAVSLVLAPCLSSLCLTVQATSTGGPKVGDKPPLLEVTTLLQAPAGAKFDAESLRGKVVVLEFWATWCGPCVAAIPHLNDLVDKFKDRPVQFVAITDEDEATIKPFLKKRPIKAWVGLDTNKAMNRAYGVAAIPHTVIVGQDGTIAAITHPEALTEQILEDVLAGRKIPLPQPGGEGAIYAGKDPDDKSLAQPLFQLLVRPSAATNSSGVGGGGRFTARGYTVRDILPRAFDQPMQSPVRILTNAPLPEGRYDFIVAQTKGSDQDVTLLLQQALKSAFGLSGKKETRETEVLLLKVKRPNAPGLVVSPTPGGASRTGPGIIEGTDFSIASLAMALERGLNKPVIDETGLTNGYDISLKWEQESRDKPNPPALTKAVEEQLGLELVPAKRPIEVTLIERLAKDTRQSGD